MSRIYNKNIASLKTIVHDTSVLDAQKILLKPANATSDERRNILDIIGDNTTGLTDRIDTIEDILDGPHIDKVFTTATTGDTAETAGRGIQLSKAHFIETGVIIKTLALPYKGADYTRNNQYCHVTFYNEAGQVIKKITSFDTQSRALDSSGISKWNFTENNIVPDDYHYACIALSGSATDNPDIKTGSQCSTYTINVIRKNGSVTFDDDLCQCYGTGGGAMNYLGDVTIEYLGPGQTLVETVSNNERRITVLEENNVAKLDEDNTFTAGNTFEETVTMDNGAVISGDVSISNGILTFEDSVDGTVIESSGATGYRYVEGIPSSFNNGICYDIGEISDLTDLSSVRFSAEGRLVQTCELWFTTSATPSTKHKWPTGMYWIDSATGTAPTLLASKNYRLVFRQEPNKIIASIAYLY